MIIELSERQAEVLAVALTEATCAGSLVVADQRVTETEVADLLQVLLADSNYGLTYTPPGA